jgi:hypothetical protein
MAGKSEKKMKKRRAAAKAKYSTIIAAFSVNFSYKTQN